MVWGGDTSPIYGHFLTESVSRLWPLLPGAELDGLPVAFTTPRKLPFVDEWLKAFGARLVELPEEGAVRFTKMFVPEPAWRLAAWVAPEMRDIHLHARRGLEVPPVTRGDVLWLSRAGLRWSSRLGLWQSGQSKRYVRVAYDEVLLEWLLGHNVTPISLESMTLSEQVGALEGSRAVAGVLGSAFHTLLMAERLPDCLYLCPPWQKGEFPAQHRLLNKQATFARALEVAAWTPRARSEGIDFPHGYRLLIPETLRALSVTVLPTLLDDPRLAAFAHPDRQRARSGGSTGSLDATVERMLLEPLSDAARMTLGTQFEAEGLDRCALEQFMTVADLNEDHGEAHRRAARLLQRLRPGAA